MYVAISLIALIIILNTEHWYNETLFNKSLTIIPQLQEGASDFKVSMWSFYSNGGLYSMMFLPKLFLENVKNQDTILMELVHRVYNPNTDYTKIRS